MIKKYIGEKNMKFYEILMEEGKKDGVVKNVVGGIIVNQNNEFLLLTRKRDDFYDGIDELPSGNMEENETIVEALTREIKEETNLNVERIENYINSFDYESRSGKKSREYNFSVKVKNVNNIKLSEHECYKWQSIEEVRRNPKITKEIKFTLEIYYFNLIEHNISF